MASVNCSACGTVYEASGSDPDPGSGGGCPGCARRGDPPVIQVVDGDPVLQQPLAPALVQATMQLADAHATRLSAVLGIAVVQAELDAPEASGAGRGMCAALESLRDLLPQGSLALQVVDLLVSYASSVVGGVDLACQGVQGIDLAGLSKAVQALALSVRSLLGLSLGLGTLSQVATRSARTREEKSSSREDAS